MLLLSALGWGFEWGIVSRNVRVYITLRNVNLHSLFALTYTRLKIMRHVHWRWRSRTGKNGASWKCRTGRTARLVLRSEHVHVLRSCVLNTPDSWRHWERESNEVNVQKKPRRQEENQIKCKRKKHVVERLHKPSTRCGVSSQARYTLSCSIQLLSFLSSLARRCARHYAHTYIILVLIIYVDPLFCILGCNYRPCIFPLISPTSPPPTSLFLNTFKRRRTTTATTKQTKNNRNKSHFLIRNKRMYG